MFTNVYEMFLNKYKDKLIRQLNTCSNTPDMLREYPEHVVRISPKRAALARSDALHQVSEQHVRGV